VAVGALVAAERSRRSMEADAEAMAAEETGLKKEAR